MVTETAETAAAELENQLSEEADVTKEVLAEQVQSLLEYDVPKQEAIQTVASRHDITSSQGGMPSAEKVSIADIDAGDEWITLEVEVVTLWESNSDAIHQVGLLGDGTDVIKFVTWADAFEDSEDLHTVEEGEEVRFENIVTKARNDGSDYDFEVHVQNTSATRAPESAVESGDGARTSTFNGTVVSVQSGSGLIKRCPMEECSRVLNDGRCSEHGAVDGEFDLRLKLVIDDGTDIQHAIMDRETTTGITGISLEEAKNDAMDALDTSVVVQQMRDKILGRPLTITGPSFDQYLLVDEYEETRFDPEAAAALLAQLSGNSSDA